jgi:hypothetical protein
MLFGSHPKGSAERNKLVPLELDHLRRLPKSWVHEHSADSIAALRTVYFVSEGKPVDMEVDNGGYLLVSDRIRSLIEGSGAKVYDFVEVVRVSKYGEEPRWVVLNRTPPLEAIRSLSEPYPFGKVDRKTQVCVRRGELQGPMFDVQGYSADYPRGITLSHFCTDEFARSCQALKINRTWFACGDQWYPEHARIHITYRIVD